MQEVIGLAFAGFMLGSSVKRKFGKNKDFKTGIVPGCITGAVVVIIHLILIAR